MKATWLSQASDCFILLCAQWLTYGSKRTCTYHGIDNWNSYKYTAFETNAIKMIPLRRVHVYWFAAICTGIPISTYIWTALLPDRRIPYRTGHEGSADTRTAFPRPSTSTGEGETLNTGGKALFQAKADVVNMESWSLHVPTARHPDHWSQEIVDVAKTNYRQDVDSSEC